MSEEHSYDVLQKKIVKVEKLLAKFRLKGDADNKEYRAYEKKRTQYQNMLENTKEYKLRQMEETLKEIQSDEEIQSKRSISSSSSSSSSSSEESVDYQLTLKKHDKVEALMKQLEEKHGAENAKGLKQHKKYAAKKEEYLTLLRKTKEWVDESYKRLEAKALAEARARAQKEQDESLSLQEKLVQKEREAAKEELEKQKEEARARIRAQMAKKNEAQRFKEIAEEQAAKDSSQGLWKKVEKLQNEANKRGEDYISSLQEQEAKGIIKVNRDG